MRSALCLFWLVPLSVTLVGCGVSKGNFNRSKADNSQQISELRSIQAEHTARLGVLESQIRNLTGQLEELGYVQRSKLGGGISELKSEIKSLERRVPPPPIVPAIALESDESFATTLEHPLKASFENALTLIRRGEFSQAIAQLNESLSHAYDNEAITARLVFWNGVCHDGLGDRKKALASYHEVATRYPRHTRTPLALIRQASVFITLGDTRTAKLTYQKIISSYPGTTEAARAKERLKEL